MRDYNYNTPSQAQGGVQSNLTESKVSQNPILKSSVKQSVVLGRKDDLAGWIENQNKKIKEVTQEEMKEFEDNYRELELELNKLNDCYAQLSKITPHNPENPLTVGVESKISEFIRITEANNEKIKKNLELLPEIQRKKKENDDFFKKFLGEKKVWLDRLKEKNFRDIAYEKGFKYFYEAKTIKLLLEGIMLEKIQDSVEKELTVRGEALGWGIMDEHKLAEERKKEEFELNKEFLDMNDEEKIALLDKEKKNEWEKEDKDNAVKRDRFNKQWKEIWSELWLPKVQMSNDEDTKSQRDLVRKATMDVTFDYFKKLCFDVWKFKNIINSAEEYVVLDKVRKYFPEEPGKQNKDEAILDKMMDMIENIKQEEEIIYCDLQPAIKKLKEYEKSHGNESAINASIDRIKNLINKISNIQNSLKKDSTILIKAEVEEVKALIKAIPDDNEKKLFKENLIDSSRLYDVFLPLTNLLMVVSFISIGKKRTKGYEEKIEKLTKENEKLKLQNKELEGKLDVLVEVKNKAVNDKVFQISSPGYKEEFSKELETVQKAKEQIEKEIRYLLNQKEEILNQRKKFFVDVIASLANNENEAVKLSQINVEMNK